MPRIITTASRVAAVAGIAIAGSGCKSLMLQRVETQYGINFSPEEEQVMLDMPDYQEDNCLWVETGFRARGLAEPVIKQMVRYAKRESQCCPNIVGGNSVDPNCVVIDPRGVPGGDPTDTGVLQLNGFEVDGFRSGTPAQEFCQEGVPRFVNEQWTQEVVYPCDQPTVLADPELQLDIATKFVNDCGFKPWTKPNYGCKPMNIFASEEVKSTYIVTNQ